MSFPHFPDTDPRAPQTHSHGQRPLQFLKREKAGKGEPADDALTYAITAQEGAGQPQPLPCPALAQDEGQDQQNGTQEQGHLEIEAQIEPGQTHHAAIDVFLGILVEQQVRFPVPAGEIVNSIVYDICRDRLLSGIWFVPLHPEPAACPCGVQLALGRGFHLKLERLLPHRGGKYIPL